MTYFLKVFVNFFQNKKSKKRDATKDFLKYCKEKPWAIECRIYDV